MNLLMLTLLTVGGVLGKGPADGQESSVAEEYYDDSYDGHGHMGFVGHLHNKHAIHNTAPQTCYDPRFGCYHSNGRHMHRYPAFHGTFYRSAYNYRNYFDYPWHAQPHEPTSLFSYNVGEDQPDAVAPAPVPPSPPQARRLNPGSRPSVPTPATTPRPAPTTRAAVPSTPAATPLPAAAPRAAATPLPAAKSLPASEYTAPPPVSRRISTAATPDVRPTSATQAVTSRRTSNPNGAKP